jgi:hypothetical protein
MVRFVTYTLELGADSAMSAEVSAVAYKLSENGRYAVELLNTILVPYPHGAQPDMVFIFEVFELPGHPEDMDGEREPDGPTH